MFGTRSIQLVRVFGIRIGVDASWFLILFLIIWSLSGYYKDVFPGQDTKPFALAVASALLFFTCVVLHELGHALVALRNGIEIPGIDLFLFGGVAKLRGDTRSPGVEFRVAIAGPLVTAAIAAGCFGLGALLEGAHGFWRSMIFSDATEPGAAVALLGYLSFVNAMLLVFNLVPAYPLDGGRIMRALVWARTGDRVRATRIAARVGRGLAYLLAAVGLYAVVQGAAVSGVWLIVISLFLGQAARGQELQTHVASQIEGLRVTDVMDAEPVAVPAGLSLERALDDYFLRYRWSWFPVVDGSGRFVGLVTRQSVDEVPGGQRAGRRVDEAIRGMDARGLSVRVDAPLESLLGAEALRTLGAVMAVDGQGVLRGVVTLERVRRALRSAIPAAG
jgi:Zn-dependent protease